MNKSHWYDGWFYDRLIAPNQDALFVHIRRLIPSGASVLDVGCGTGRLAFAISDVAQTVVGIDLSLKNIERARRNLARNPSDKITFEHKPVDQIRPVGHGRFDYAVLTYVIHEVNESERIQLLTEVSEIADHVIIGDYVVPVGFGLWTAIDEVVEYVAGREHHRNFKSYIAAGGLKGLIAQTSFTILEEVRDSPRTSQLLLLGSRVRSKAADSRRINSRLPHHPTS
jgi:SAM-dependent methyltransferase